MFDSARAKVARAKRHAVELNSLEQSFLRNKCSGIITEVDPTTGDQVTKVKFSRHVPTECAAVVSDAANNLRDALDHIGFAVAVAGGTTKPRHTAFPFGRSAADLENSIQGRSKDVPGEILAVFRRFKPYQGGNDRLYALNTVANANKHTMLRPMAVSVGGFSLSVGRMSGGYLGIGGPPCTYNRRENEIILLRQGRGSKSDHELEVQLFISFDEVEPLEGEPAVPTLDNFAAEVERVIAAVEDECVRLDLTH
jgi:hypothetical protein